MTYIEDIEQCQAKKLSAKRKEKKLLKIKIN